MNNSDIIEKILSLEAHASRMQQIAAELKSQLQQPEAKRKKRRGLTEERKAELDAHLMKVILKNSKP